jgi:hypothetical protein
MSLSVPKPEENSFFNVSIFLLMIIDYCGIGYRQILEEEA